ncbi:hypothetical protein KM043_002542 [Ampulex compressa]|nr:hypothetical protein KM043_002542 [Ampulex compressa]
MTSFLTDVLITAGKLEKLNLDEKVSEIQKEISKLKNDVQNFMNDNHVDFTAKLTRDQHLLVKAENMLTQMNDLQMRIDSQVKIKLSGSTKELQELSQTLKEANISLQLSNQLLSLHECIKSIKQFHEGKQYVRAAETLQNMHALLQDPQNSLQELDIYVAIMEEHCNLCSLFISDVACLLHKRICWTGVDSTKDEKTTTLSIKDDFEDMQDLITGLHLVDDLSNFLMTFTKTLMNSIITPIIKNNCSVQVVHEKVFTVEILDKKKVPSYKSVLYNLELLFKFLYQHFNIKIDDEETFLQKMRPYLMDQLAECLTTDCISRTIPTSSTDLKNFEPVIKTINDFQSFLVQIGFITSDQLFLSEYTKNIDILFIDKICQDLLKKAKNIMKKDLHDCMRHEPKVPFKFSEDEYENHEMEIKKNLSENTFQLPACQISKSANETLELARNILEEACCSSDACAIRLFYTCRNVFEMYAGLVREHHRKFLETIPQQVALFHNNCMYLAHHLLTLGYEYRDKLPTSVQRLNLTFADQTLVLRDVGSKCFLEHMKYQRNIILDILRESGLASLGQTSTLHPNTERTLRQCIRQLELLKTVWLDVLPINIYCKAVGCITNSMIEDLVTRVTSVEDIPSDVASELVVLFNMVTKRAPLIFPQPDTIHLYVRKWSKFLELINVLGASLKEIEARWGNGAGPLAQEFTALQTKQLIRALFQNTERRSNLLASIKQQ